MSRELTDLAGIVVKLVIAALLVAILLTGWPWLWAGVVVLVGVAVGLEFVGE